MAKGPMQKLKLLYLCKILQNETNEEHPLSLSQIIEKLEAVGVGAERKSLYDDMEQLRAFGLDIVAVRDKTTRYYVASGKFELPELKLLVDAVQSSRFLTRKKSDQLIKKIEGLSNIYDAKELQRQVFVANRIKNMNESIYYNIDYLHSAITGNKKITFRYVQLFVDFSKPEKIVKRDRHEGKIYCVSPFALTWDDENYYLIAYDGDDRKIKHFRVDRMENISETNLPREGEKFFEKFDMGIYSKKLFGMFGGEEQKVSIRFSNSLIGVVVDKFGSDIFISPDGENHFILRADCAVSPQFFAWVFSFGDSAKIISPESVVLGMKQFIEKAAKQYE
jgi:predicted DNA-binding transcriptional regulator YafY